MPATCTVISNSSTDAFTNPGVGQYGNAPRTIDSALNQFRKNIDLVFSKDTKFGAGQSGEIRLEILNLTNTAKFRPARRWRR